MELVFGGDFDYDRGGLVLIALGMGLYLAAATLNQALLARARARPRVGVLGHRGGRPSCCSCCWWASTTACCRSRSATRARRVCAQLRRCTRSTGDSHGSVIRGVWPSDPAWASRPPTSRSREPTARFTALRAPRRAGDAALLSRRRHARVHQAVLLLPRQRRGLRRARTPRRSASPARAWSPSRAFAEKHGLNVPLLADRERRVAKAYGAWARAASAPSARSIIVDEEGVVRHRHDHALGLDFQTVADLREALDSLPAHAA